MQVEFINQIDSWTCMVFDDGGRTKIASPGAGSEIIKQIGERSIGWKCLQKVGTQWHIGSCYLPSVTKPYEKSLAQRPDSRFPRDSTARSTAKIPGAPTLLYRRAPPRIGFAKLNSHSVLAREFSILVALFFFKQQLAMASGNVLAAELKPFPDLRAATGLGGIEKPH